MSYNLQFKRFSSSSILIEWPSVIDENVLKDIAIYKKKLQNKYIKEKVEVINGYNTILIDYVFTIENINDRFIDLKSTYKETFLQSESEIKVWEIPVCYDVCFGTDLELLSQEKKCSKDAIIQLHSEAIYTVFFIGFLPGFLYLGGLNEQLHFNRKSIPNLEVKKGAVGIGGKQTGIYPQNSPGGWHIIGNSPINFFDRNLLNPCFAKSGDRVKFVPVSLDDYNYIDKQVQLNTYNLKYTLVDV